jgi:hypothetical protein
METKHTEGIWFVSGGSEIVSMPSQCKITNRVSGWNYEEAQANANLMSASPELLECLIEAVETSRLEFNKVPEKWINAIKKATNIK